VASIHAVYLGLSLEPKTVTEVSAGFHSPFIKTVCASKELMMLDKMSLNNQSILYPENN
jgi:hypothetical protein